MRRSNIEITINILEVALPGANITKIVYQSNINFRLAYRYLDKMNMTGLLEKNGDGHKTTEKGKEFIEKAKAVLDTCGMLTELEK